MVCETCEKKLGKLVVPDKWKEGARNVVGGSDGGVRISAAGPSSNKIAEKRKARLAASAPINKQCKICKSKISMEYYYCNDCAYKKGICTMCGRKVLDTKKYKMSTR